MRGHFFKLQTYRCIRCVMPWALFGLMLPAITLGTSLFDAERYQAIVASKVGHQIGDLLTVIIYESSSASNKANTEADTDTSLGLGLNYSGDARPTTGTVSMNSEFAGGGQVNRSGKVIASIAVAITAIEANGDYRIAGEQSIELNNESQFIRVAGLIRPEDISGENTVLSSRIAQAQIEFEGQGLLSSAEKPGLLTKLFQWLF